jgi:hypothetical protein
MKLLLLMLSAAGALAQTTTYPGAIDTDTSLFVTRDNVQTTLTVPMQVTDTVAVVKSSTGFVPNMIATVCETVTANVCTQWEHMLVTAISGNTLTVTRGIAGTTSMAHAANKFISALIDSAHQKVLKDAVINIETALGPNLTNVSTGAGAFLNVANYTWSAQTCNASMVCSPGGAAGASLITGNNTVTLTPVPKGMNGSDTLHRVYVSGGTGTPEGCLITGGSGTSGQPSGQIIINCQYAHSGAFTIQSIDGGIQEAIQAAASAGGGTVQIPAGTYTCYAATMMLSNVRLLGAGRNATILIPSNPGINAWWGGPNTQYGMIAASPADSIEVASLTLNLQTPTVVFSAFTATGLTNSWIHDLAVRNPQQAGTGGTTMINFNQNTPNYNDVIQGNFFYLGSGCTDNNGSGAIGINNSFRVRILANYAEGGCVNSYNSSNGSDNIFANNVFNLAGSTMSAGNQAYMADSSNRNVFIGNECWGNGTGPACYTIGADGGAVQPDSNDNVFIGNLAYNCGYAFAVSGAAAGHVARGTVISGNSVFGCSYGVLVQPAPYPGSIENTTIANNTIDSVTNSGITVQSLTAGATITGTSITGNQVRNSGASGISVYQNGANLVKSIVISANTLNHNNPYGIIINSTAGNPVNEGTITSNFMLDTGTPVVQTQGLIFGDADPATHWVVSDNNFANGMLVSWPANNITNMLYSYIGGNICGGAGTACAGLPIGVTYRSSTSNFASIGACGTNNAGSFAGVPDSTTATWGAAITGGGTNIVLAFCNGTAWTVAGK